MIARIDSPDQSLPDAESFTVIGDPGCDGLGAESLTAFAAALAAAEGDFILVLGDLIPRDSDVYFNRVCELANAFTKKPIFVAKGNHDGVGYADRLGLAEYVIHGKIFSVAVLDNASGRFTRESTDLMRGQMADKDAHTLHLAFHIPPPNRFHGASMKEADWWPFVSLLQGGRKRLGWLLCGHVHSYFEDVVAGMPLVVSGGGGSEIDVVARVATPPYHVLEFKHHEDGSSSHHRHDILAGGQAGGDLEMRKLLLQTLANESNSFLHSSIRAGEAMSRNHFRLARLYRAAAESQRIRAQTMYRILFSPPNPGEALSGVIAEYEDISHSWGVWKETARDLGDVLAAQALDDSLLGAEPYLALFQQALEKMEAGDDDPGPTFCMVCESCGRLLAEPITPANCPVCGAPRRRLRMIL